MDSELPVDFDHWFCTDTLIHSRKHEDSALSFRTVRTYFFCNQAMLIRFRCHTFDKKADGYAKAEAVNAMILKRLDDAIRDGDAIRAVIRGTATNSDGRTPGIASPSSEAQARAIRSAYANAGISDYGLTSYLECHGTGRQIEISQTTG